MQDQLNLSPICSQNNNDHSFDIQDVCFDNFQGTQFRNDIRQFIQTQKQTLKESQFNQDEVIKGSFLQQMQKLGKSLSFQSSVYNIYQEDNFQNKKDFKLLKQYPNGNPLHKKLPTHYIIDFQKKVKKKKSSSKIVLSLNRQSSKKKKKQSENGFKTNLYMSKMSMSTKKLSKKNIKHLSCRWSLVQQTPQLMKRISNNSSANVSNLSSNLKKLDKGKKAKSKEVKKKLLGSEKIFYKK